MTDDERTVYLGLGSNVGDRRRYLIAALKGLEAGMRVDAVSSLYETDPVGPQDQGDYYNAACRGTTRLAPAELLSLLKQLERSVGRTRTERWGPREIDIDILLYGGEVIETSEISIPHPEMTKRAFVLVPLAEIATDARHPVAGQSVAELAAGVDGTGVRCIEGRDWVASGALPG